MSRVRMLRVRTFSRAGNVMNLVFIQLKFEDILGFTTNLEESNGVEADVLKNKKDKRGIVIRNKARLVAQGHTQEEGIDYDEVFTPIARIEAIRLFLAYASFMGFTASSDP
nr:copia protein [Tanacetum cinerariifolium]